MSSFFEKFQLEVLQSQNVLWRGEEKKNLHDFLILFIYEVEFIGNYQGRNIKIMIQK